MKTKFVAQVAVETECDAAVTKKAIKRWIENTLGDSGSWPETERVRNGHSVYFGVTIERVRVRSVDKD